jgi:DNA-binding CsgD family transcriptional regulator
MRRTGKLSPLSATGTAGWGAGGMTWFMAAPREFLQLSLTAGLQHSRHGRVSSKGMEMTVRHALRTFHALRQNRAALHELNGLDGRIKNQILRGLLSCSQIALQLGEAVETIEIAQNFAEISVALHA